MQSVETQIIPRTSDIGNLEVKRALPSRERTNRVTIIGAGRRNRTPIIGLEGRGNSHYTIPAWRRARDSNPR